MKKLILLGGGGHCRACIDVIEDEGKFKIVGILDTPKKVGTKVLGYPVIDEDSNISKFVSVDMWFLITVGQVKTPTIRLRLYKKLAKLNANMATVISPLAKVSSHASIGKGTIIMHQCLINSSAKVGNNCIINTKALIEHDVTIENHCHISTCAVANGGVHIGTGSFLGSNAVAKENVIIGENCVVAAGSVVMQDIEAGILYGDKK